MLTPDETKELNNLFTFPPTVKLGDVINNLDKRINDSDYKDSCRVATVSNILLSGNQLIDGVNTVDGDRVLVKNQIIQSQNGIYVVSSGLWSRSEDANADSEVTSGLRVFSEEGTVNSGKTWVVTTQNPIIVDTTPIVFTELFSTPLSSANPQNVNKNPPSPGVAADAARSDHKHDVDTAAPIAGIGSGNSEGTSTSLARSDHNHALRESGGTDLTIGSVNDLDLIQRNGLVLSGIQRSGIDVSAIHSNIQSEIQPIINKATPVGSDILLIEDSADLFNKKSVTISSLPVGAHSLTHELAGSDEVDGDHLAVDFVPSNYVRDTSPIEVSSVNHLTAHLKGIDNLLFNPIIAESLLASTSTLVTFTPKLSMVTPSIPLGVYRLEYSYGWNYNSGTSDFIGRIQVDGTINNPATGFEWMKHEQEPKDAAGISYPPGSGSGTNQAHRVSGFIIVNFAVAGIHTFVLEWASSVAGVISTIWDARLILTKIG